jgi:hypothetical protein
MLGNRSTRALIDGFTQALADQDITRERDE